MRQGLISQRKNGEFIVELIYRSIETPVSKIILTVTKFHNSILERVLISSGAEEQTIELKINKLECFYWKCWYTINWAYACTESRWVYLYICLIEISENRTSVAKLNSFWVHHSLALVYNLLFIVNSYCQGVCFKYFGKWRSL